MQISDSSSTLYIFFAIELQGFLFKDLECYKIVNPSLRKQLNKHGKPTFHRYSLNPLFAVGAFASGHVFIEPLVG